MVILWFNNQKEWRKKLKMFFWNNRYHNCKSRGVHKEGERASSGGQETETKVSCNLSSNYNQAYIKVRLSRNRNRSRLNTLEWHSIDFYVSRAGHEEMLRRNKAQSSFLKHSFDNCLNVVQVYQCLQQVQKSRGCSCSLDLHVRSSFNRIDRHLGSFLKKIQLLSPTIASVIFCLLEIRWF